ncbi:hypothetical protein F5Y18DRAFT_420195 [Xylariaceae sp. FL1019]|nr:hypothetical protein F5Y18DRAFT_420195 [Xylariaceae sp. FL1019]
MRARIRGRELELTRFRTSKARRRSPPPSRDGDGDGDDDDAHAAIGLSSLPLELHQLIIAYLDIDSLAALRHTCRLYYHVINVDLVRQLFTRNGRLSVSLTACCNQCLAVPGLHNLVTDSTLGDRSWRSVCFRCWSQRITQDYHLNPWPVIHLANGYEGYICHFCNWPVVNTQPGTGINRLHGACQARRRIVVLTWAFMAFLQFGLGVICAVLGWTKYRQNDRILIPASVDFALAMISVAAFIFRIYTTDERRYARALFIELVLTILRIPPVAYTARSSVVARTNAGLLPRFGFGVFVINL